MISNSRDPRTLGSTVVALGCQAGTATQAATFGDVMVLANPSYAVPNLTPEPFAAKPAADAANSYPQRDGHHARLDHQAAGIADAFGYDAVDAGPLAEGWRFERAMPAHGVPPTALRAVLAAARRGVQVPHGSWQG